MIKPTLERINLSRTGLGVWLLLTICSEPAFGYLDPGTGSMITSTLVGLGATILFFLKGLYYKSFRGVLGVFGRDEPGDMV